EDRSRSADAVQVRQRLLQAERAGRWTWPLLAATGALTLLSAWLGWQLAALQQARRGEWRAAAAPRADDADADPEPGPGRPATAPIPFVTSEMRLPAVPGPPGTQRLPPAWPPSTSPELLNPPTVAMDPEPRLQAVQTGAALAPPADAAAQRTAVQPRPAETAPRDVSIEELIDLEQQAEFFAVLGQDEAAIDLLMEHLRHTGGSSPLPYLKLLEIYGRRGDRADYERMRSRFNHRFNAYAPEWGVDLQAGRSLADYPGVIPRLEQVWPRPLEAMAELEALLFRKSRGDLFELPAYREVLFLYAIARDLLDREVGEGGTVDLLLPLAARPAFNCTAPAPYLELTGDEDATVSRPTEPPASAGELDLDLSAADDRQASIFDTLDHSRASDGPPSLR
ncbi:MAG: hypothetical protein KGK09_00840, partial [Burkholderiales bacterium]|nr:hypothetical protein [Burkholderiales bacterium]